MANYDGTGIEYYPIPNFEFSNGSSSMDIKLGYREFNKGSSSSILNERPLTKEYQAKKIPTCFGGRINTTLNFTKGALKDHHVIVVAMLGNGESTSPSHTTSFPTDLRYQDQIKAQYELVTKHLGIKKLRAVIGFSMGGQQAYYWGVMHGSSPDPFVENIVCICTSAKTSGHNVAFLEGPICSLEYAHDYVHYRRKINEEKIQPRQALREHEPVDGLRNFGRAYTAWLTSAEWFDQELWKEMGAESLRDFICPWERNGGAGRFDGWGPDDLLVLAQQWQAGDIGSVAVSDGQGDYKQALSRIEARVLLMPSTTDQYFRWEASKAELAHLKHGVWAPIETVWGHIAGGGANKESVDFMDSSIGEFLRDEAVGGGVVAETGFDVAS